MIVGVATIVFVATRLLADPARKMLPISASHQQYLETRHQLGLDKPLVQQFGDFLAGAAHLSFGRSILYPTSTAGAVFDRLPNTLELVGLALALSLLLAVPFGFLAATRPGTWSDTSIVATSLLGLSLPQFWLASMLILAAAVHLHILPTSGAGGIRSLVLPVITLALPITGRVTQMVRSTVIDELHRQYVLAARARGLSLPYVLYRHVLRNAFVPVSSYVSLETAKALAGSTVVVETVFAFPGLGYLAVQAAQASDIVLIEAIVIIVAALVVVANLLFDLVNGVADPRTRASS